MPTKLERAEILHTPEEKEKLRRVLIKSGESISNYYRRLDGLPPLSRGVPNNKNNKHGRKGKPPTQDR